jgi:hypothetical protein
MLKNILLLSLFFLSACSSIPIDEPKCKIKLIRIDKEVNEIEICKAEIK